MALAFLKSQHAPPGRSASAEARRMIAILLRTENCTASQTAAALGVHPRTLQRRLKAEGARFERIKDEVRRDMAEQMLRDKTLAITEIAFALHYGNASAFTRSCRRWFGAPPVLARRTLSRNGKTLSAVDKKSRANRTSRRRNSSS